MACDIPQRLGIGQVEFCRLGLQQHRELAAICCVRLHGAPAINRCLEVVQTLVQASLRNWRRQVADQRRARPTFGNRTFGRVIRGVKVNIGQVVNQTVWPAGARHAALLAGHELQRTVGAKVQHGIGLEVLAQVAIKR